ncbi:TfoX/Sxy family protein [Streptomyces ehimensis]|uniref:TfoX/Sxy family protein n=1 Tax=Streptomyces ehimensis TaxID=68195 RepID=A0ABV9BT84_9ACTN
MAYDEVLAERVLERLEPEGVVAKKMFGTIAYLLEGNTVVTLHDDGLWLRVGPDGVDEALSRPGARPAVFRGKEADGWVVVAGDVLDDDVLDDWLETALQATVTLSPK